MGLQPYVDSISNVANRAKEAVNRNNLVVGCTSQQPSYRHRRLRGQLKPRY